MVTSRELRKVSPGWQVVLFEGCEQHLDGSVNHASADVIRKWWFTTKKEAQAFMQYDAVDDLEDED